MIVLFYFDWFGSSKELSEMEKMMASALGKEGGVKYMGTYAPDSRKFHFVSLFETESYDKLMAVLMDPKNPPRDYKKLAHGSFEVLRGPLHAIKHPQMGVGMDCFGICRGTEKSGDLRKTLLVRFLCKCEILTIGLAFTGECFF